MSDSFRRAQLRYDAEEPPEGIPDERIEEAARELVGDFAFYEHARFVRAVERATGADDLSDCRTLDEVWREHHPDPDEE